jgi:hypothetical protein
VKRSADVAAEVPPGPITWTSTTPAAPAGAKTRRALSFSTVKLAVRLTPKATVVAQVKPLPVSVTSYPPAVSPACGLSPVTAGAAGVT